LGRIDVSVHNWRLASSRNKLSSLQLLIIIINILAILILKSTVYSTIKKLKSKDLSISTI